MSQIKFAFIYIGISLIIKEIELVRNVDGFTEDGEEESEEKVHSIEDIAQIRLFIL